MPHSNQSDDDDTQADSPASLGRNGHLKKTSDAAMNEVYAMWDKELEEGFEKVTAAI